MEQFFADNVKLIFAICFGTSAIAILVSNFHRALRKKKRLEIPEFDIKFSEKWVTGFSNKNNLTKLGGASNCLIVELSRNALAVRLMFPFNLGFLPQVYDLEHFIPIDKIKRIQADETGDKGRVIIDFETAGGEKRIELTLRKRQEFLRAFKAPVARQPVPSGILT